MKIRKSTLLTLLGFCYLENAESFQLTPRSTAYISQNNNKSLRAEEKNEPFTFFSMFGKDVPVKKKESNTGSSTSAATVSVKKPLVHPAQKEHINPLNSLDPTRPKAQGKELLPIHPDVHSGILENGLSYVILPNRAPSGRFEAHLQVFSGSADELEHQQGIAHLTEHVAYMGSRKRERLFGTGSQTNAYTDFHHTVFYAACPNIAPGMPGVKMMPFALDALCDVMEARAEPARIEKERQAVLSEMTMVNTIEYRVECQILATLHRENRLAKRFPIGKEVLINSWDQKDVLTWHRTHYRPDNVLLYIVGDVDIAETEKYIQQKFGHLNAGKQGSYLTTEAAKDASDLAEALVANSVKAGQSWHYPPAIHNFNIPAESAVPSDKVKDSDYDLQLQERYPLDEKVNLLTTFTNIDGKPVRPHIYRHELLQSFSLHIFAKRPIEPIKDMKSLKKSLARRIALAALQIRLNVNSRGENPAFTFVEFNQLDSPREGCAVCSLDLTAEPHRWKDAILKCVSEIRKLGLYGCTSGEIERYASSLFTDAGQLAAQGDRISHSDQLSFLMETIACGHTFMSPIQSYQLTELALSTMTVEDVKEAAEDLCAHVTSLHPDGAACESGELIAIACCPKSIVENDKESYCDEEGLVAVIAEACKIPVEPEEEIIVPQSLVDEKTLNGAIESTNPVWKSASFTDGTMPIPVDKITRPFTLRRLSNGVRVGVARSQAESQRGSLRLTVPGGRHAEKMLGFKNGSMAVGARTMQEGGAFGPWTREQVELFCVDHLIMVEINCTEEAITFDFVFPTTEVGNTGFGEEAQGGIVGTEAVLQVLREVIADFRWEGDALGRAKSSYRSQHDTMIKSLEGKTTEVVMEAMTSKDNRFLSIENDQVNSISLEEAREAVMSQLQPENLEVSVVGDFDVAETLELIRQYIGSIPMDVNKSYEKSLEKDDLAVPPLALPGKHIELELEDSDPRAISYVAGSAPNRWGFFQDGTTVSEKLLAIVKNISDNDRKRWAHPLFANAALALISEIVNRRLFSTVRERKQLTYDANFSLTGFDSLKGGWFLVTVTASKEKAQQALDACKEVLETLRKKSPVTPDNLSSAQRVVINRHEGELRTNKYVTEIMSGIQQESIPFKGPLSVTDFNSVVMSVTVKDLQLVLECLGLDEDKLYTAIGRTIQPEGYVPPEDDVVAASPIIGARRGGALMN